MAAGSIIDLLKPETEFTIKAAELVNLIRESQKADFLTNAVKCEVPFQYIRETISGEKEGGTPEPDSENWQQDEPDVEDFPFPEVLKAEKQESGLTIVRRSEQGAEWIDIQDIIRKGRAPISIPPGTEIEFTLKNGERAVVAVAAVNHYDERDAVFHFRRIIGRHCMNTEHTNAGGWRDSDARSYINEKLIELLPDELVAVISEHTTVQVIDGEKLESKDRLFLPSEYEVMGETEYSEYNGTDKQLKIFEERIKRIVTDDDGDPVWWWLADPSAAGATSFCCFDYSGSSNYTGAANDLGVAPLFVIR